MIRIACVDTEHMDVEAEEKYTLRGERKIEGGEADKVDAALLVPAFDPSRSEANELYEKYKTDQTEWVQDYFQPIIRETYVEYAEGALFTESFADDGGYVFYDVSVQYIESANEYRTDLNEVGWRKVDNPPVVPEGYMYYEDTASSLWYNVLVDEHELKLDRMDIQGQPPEPPEEEDEEEDEEDVEPSPSIGERIMDATPEWTGPFALSIGAMALFTVALAVIAFLAFGQTQSVVDRRAGGQQVSASLSVRQTVGFYQASAYAEFKHLIKQVNTYPLANTQLIEVEEKNKGYYRVTVAADPKPDASTRYIRDFDFDLGGQAKSRQYVGESQESRVLIINYSIPIATTPRRTKDFLGREAITKRLNALSTLDFFETTYSVDSWAPDQGYLSQSVEIELSQMPPELIDPVFYFPGLKITGFTYYPKKNTVQVIGTLYSTG